MHEQYEIIPVNEYQIGILDAIFFTIWLLSLDMGRTKIGIVRVEPRLDGSRAGRDYHSLGAG